jgi:membrane protein implicated in regulation of membrane protease activity
VLVAVAASIAMLAVVRPGLARRLHTGPELVLGTARLIGVQAVTPVRLSAAEPGQLKIDGELWTAKPYDETLVIEPGQTVEVLQIRGATAYVHPLPTLET